MRVGGALVLACVTFVGTAHVSAQEGTPSPNPQVSKPDALFEKVEEAIGVSSRRYLTAGVHTPWQIFHGLLAFRDKFLVKVEGEKVSALDWLVDDAKYRNANIFQVTRYGGRAHPYTKPYLFEGHPTQFLAILSMLKLPREFEFRVGDRKVTVDGLVRNAQMEVNSRVEVTWTLWALSHYVDADEVWTNKHNQSWNVGRLVQIQARENLHRAACGGTHGLYAMSFARNAYLQSGRRLSGSWLEADQRIRQYVESARQLQNSDGTFSANYFSGRQYSNDFKTRLATSGHTLEFVIMALPESRLKEEWVRRGVNVIAADLLANRRSPADCGPLYHAVHGLVLYRDRIRAMQARSETALRGEQEADAETTQ